MITSPREAEVQALHILMPLFGMVSALSTVMSLFAASAGV